LSKPRISPRPHEVSTFTTAQLREAFVVEKVFAGDGLLQMVFTDLDRMALGGARPTNSPIKLENDRETGAEFFLARRELGIINVGAAGHVKVDGKEFALANLDGLYVSMGSREVLFSSDDPAKPAKFFLLSCPAHAAIPTTHIRKDQVKPRELGTQSTANKRKLYQYIHPNGIKSCQLVMGFTELEDGSVWNTMPPHTHSRRTEIYFYFDLGENVVSHFMGPPQATRNLWMHGDQAVLSPNWSIHCGCGTGAYRFIWAMAGENQVFDDMDQVAKNELI
jgi:4-deoxy-L-threo-5-hexosulose-uronate ketol-isomerase